MFSKSIARKACRFESDRGYPSCYNLTVKRVNGIAAVMGFVIAYDTLRMVTRQTTITADYREAFERYPVQTMLGTGYLLAHLHNWPRGFHRIDLFNGYALLFGYMGKRLQRKRV